MVSVPALKMNISESSHGPWGDTQSTHNSVMSSVCISCGVYIVVELFFEFSPKGIKWWFIRLYHATRQIPARFVFRVDKQNTAVFVVEDRVGAYPFAGLFGVTFSEVFPPRFGIALVEGRFGVHVTSMVPAGTRVCLW